MRGFGAYCVFDKTLGSVFRNGGLVMSPFQWNDNSTDTKEFVKADSNGDTVVTGEELCSHYGKTCLFTQNIFYNVNSSQGNIQEAGSALLGCYGGVGFDFYRTTLMWGFGAYCV
jgi:hypothetical protein